MKKNFNLYPNRYEVYNIKTERTYRSYTTMWSAKRGLSRVDQGRGNYAILAPEEIKKRMG